MKVNITGKGFIPGINSIAPVYNRELDESQVRRLLNFNNLRVFDSITGKLITKKSISTIVNESGAEKKPDVPVTPVVEETEKKTYTAGEKITLSKTKLYSASTSKNAVTTKTGTFYIYSSEIVGYSPQNTH